MREGVRIQHRIRGDRLPGRHPDHAARRDGVLHRRTKRTIFSPLVRRSSSPHGAPGTPGAAGALARHAVGSAEHQRPAHPVSESISSTPPGCRGARTPCRAGRDVANRFAPARRWATSQICRRPLPVHQQVRFALRKHRAEHLLGTSIEVRRCGGAMPDAADDDRPSPNASAAAPRVQRSPDVRPAAPRTPLRV